MIAPYSRLSCIQAFIARISTPSPPRAPFKRPPLQIDVDRFEVRTSDCGNRLQKEEKLQKFEIDPTFGIPDATALTSLYDATHAIAVQKCQASLGEHARQFIARSPFVCIGTQDGSGRADVSPRGDPPGFVKMLDDWTLAIPDRPGNNRLDSLTNIIANPTIGLLFIVPGFDDTLRVNGAARLTRDPALLETMSVNGRVPTLAIVVSIQEVFLHCAKAFRRSHLWDQTYRQDRSEMPSLIKMILDETTGAPDENAMRKIDEDLEQDYRRTLY